MNTEYRKRAKYLIIFWIITWVITIVYALLLIQQLAPQIVNPDTTAITTGGILGSIGLLINLLGIIGYLSLIVGVFYLAKSKGYEGWIGIILGLFNLFGLIIMLILKDKTNTTNQGKKKTNKWLIILISIPIALVILGIIATFVLDAINPLEILEEAKRQECSAKCSSDLNVDVCIAKCVALPTQ